MILDRVHIGMLIPHAGNMVLWDSVSAWDAEGLTCVTRSHQSPANPLLSKGKLSAVHLIEYGAQVMAIHGGLLAAQAGGRAAPGLLVGARNVTWRVAELSQLSELRCTAIRHVAGPSGWLYSFTISAGEGTIAEGRVSVIPLATP